MRQSNPFWNTFETQVSIMLHGILPFVIATRLVPFSSCSNFRNSLRERRALSRNLAIPAPDWTDNFGSISALLSYDQSRLAQKLFNFKPLLLRGGLGHYPSVLMKGDWDSDAIAKVVSTGDRTQDFGLPEIAADPDFDAKNARIKIRRIVSNFYHDVDESSSDSITAESINPTSASCQSAKSRKGSAPSSHGASNSSPSDSGHDEDDITGPIRASNAPRRSARTTTGKRASNSESTTAKSPAKSPAQVVPAKEVEKLQRMRVADLKELCRGRGLRVMGNKTALLERLREDGFNSEETALVAETSTIKVVKKVQPVTSATSTTEMSANAAAIVAKTKSARAKSSNVAAEATGERNTRVMVVGAAAVQGSKMRRRTGGPDRCRESELWALGHGRVAGVDECRANRGLNRVEQVGRGPLAGPVVAAAVVLPENIDLTGIDDSKKLSESQREAVYKRLTSDPLVEWSVSILDNEEIDRVNILVCTMKAMEIAIRNLTDGMPDFVLVDGNRCPPGLPGPCEAIVKGDSKCAAIAAASIIAKVTRDRMMVEYHKRWPGYKFAQHKGYGTKEHLDAISKLGPCPIHRMTFAPMSRMSPSN